MCLPFAHVAYKAMYFSLRDRFCGSISFGDEHVGETLDWTYIHRLKYDRYKFSTSKQKREGTLANMLITEDLNFLDFLN